MVYRNKPFDWNMFITPNKYKLEFNCYLAQYEEKKTNKMQQLDVYY